MVTKSKPKEVKAPKVNEEKIVKAVSKALKAKDTSPKTVAKKVANVISKETKVAKATSTSVKEPKSEDTKSALGKINETHKHLMAESEAVLKSSAKVIKDNADKFKAVKKEFTKKPTPKAAAKKPVVKKSALVNDGPKIDMPKRISTKGLLNSDVAMDVKQSKLAPWESTSAQSSPQVHIPAVAPSVPEASTAVKHHQANIVVPEGKTISFDQVIGKQQTASAPAVKKESDGTISFATLMGK